MKSVITLFLLTISMITTSVASGLTAAESDAQALINNYFVALSRGDTSTLKSMMTGDLLKKRTRLLDNPTYPAYLSETYGNAQFTIDDTKTTDSGDIVIDASITFDSDNISRRRFYIRMEIRSSSPSPALYIYNETQAD
jgi:hypothetical protein